MPGCNVQNSPANKCAVIDRKIVVELGDLEVVPDAGVCSVQSHALASGRYFYLERATRRKLGIFCRGGSNVHVNIIQFRRKALERKFDRVARARRNVGHAIIPGQLGRTV